MEVRSRQIPPQVDNVRDAKGIYSLLSNKYKELLNLVSSDSSVISRIDENITDDLRSLCDILYEIYVSEGWYDSFFSFGLI